MEREQFLLQFITDNIVSAKAFLDGGGKWIQLRMKGASSQEIIEAGTTVRDMCRNAGAIFILNDDPQLALEIGADGVHIGKNDMSPIQARSILGDKAIIGATANSIEDILRLSSEPIDYIGLGPYRFTMTKKNLSPVLGIEGYKIIFSQVKNDIPVVVIGGIELADIDILKRCGAQAFAVSGAIERSTNKEQMTIKLKQEICRA